MTAAPMRLRDAIAIAFPHGGMTVAGLRTEARATLALIGAKGKRLTYRTTPYVLPLSLRLIIERPMFSAIFGTIAFPHSSILSSPAGIPS